ncbi:DEAD/DEAH box helicase [Candidatus Schneideria nysicola]|uniref:DEAD/DEAH box helicase n=1 Tax=Candidatus Schneideria nysicola TaxID=1081631 RepID=UPI001CAA6D4A|nr:DEAD/DEAH box helicase [Candidatus Schneideria nysicola]UAJ65892.1 DEAD/DEAH box helicase [Candidatus Schneideria nysicola]
MSEKEISFSSLGLSQFILQALNDLGYTHPSPIQAKCIPYLLIGRDILGTAQTGSGKTAAFSLPLIQNINPEFNAPQVLILTPTRELAVQVGEACSHFSKYIKNIKTIVLYGGQNYTIQIRALQMGAQIIVGTPGRLLDHLNRGTLNLSSLRSLVIDEADEMLRMGFIESVEDILKKIPKEHQTALFSATMPESIRLITHRFMKKPYEIGIQTSIKTRPDIRQSYCKIQKGISKYELLSRFLEIEDFDAVLIFVRTKIATIQVAKVLEKNGYHNIAVLNGDMTQSLREQTLKHFRDGQLNILIATDIAARGLDVDRISLVINYDLPTDSESYIHRIGRTGRAGRIGRALLFVEPHEKYRLRNIERTIKITIPEVKPPTSDMLITRRLEKFSEKLEKLLSSDDIDAYRNLLKKLINLPIFEKKSDTLSAILLKLAQGNRPLILPPDPINIKKIKNNHSIKKISKDMNLYRIGVGRHDGIEVHHILNIFSKKVDIKSQYIGRIKLFDYYSTIELSKSIPINKILNLSGIRLLNKTMKIRIVGVN